MVSIIVPVYNGEKYITRCIESLKKQTYKNIQIVIVNDGSTDNTKKICEELANNDKRILFISQHNQGVTATRKYGVENSQGQYIYFVDCDDYLLPDHIESFRAEMHPNSCICVNDSLGGEDIKSCKEYIKKILVSPYLWGMTMSMYSKDLLKDALNTPRHINIGEDLIANILIARNNINFTHCYSNGYIYTCNPESVTHRRIFTLEYEERFIAEVENALGKNIAQYKKELYLFKLRCLRGLISHNVKIPNNHALKNEVKRNTDIHLGIGDKIVLNVKNHYLAYLLLKILSKTRSLLGLKD